ncbi:MAG: CoA transferase [Dehalococcoidia bacterium]
MVMHTPLTGLRAIELSERPAGWYAGAMFAQLGADVVAVQRPSAGHPVRYAHLEQGKRLATLDWSDERNGESVRSLLRDADVFVTTLAPAEAARLGLTYDDLRDSSPRLVYVALTPFGLDGPYRDYQADELILEALMGLMDLTGEPDREPLKLGGAVIEQMAGLTAFVAAETALLQRAAGVGAQLVDVAMLDAAVSMMEHSPAIWAYLHRVRKRTGRWGALAGWGLYPARDGFVGIISGLGDMYQRFREHLGGDLLDAKFADIGSRTQHAAEMHAAIINHTSARAKREVFEAGQRAGLPFGYVCTIPELLSSPQLNARQFFEQIDGPDGRRLTVPGLPFRIDPNDAPANASPPARPAAGPPTRPLAGVRVLDLGFVWAGPHCTRLLADMGAQVIKVEGPDVLDPIRGPRQPPSAQAGVYPDAQPGERPYNRHGYFNERNRNKLGIALDLRRSEGRALFFELLAVSDILVENFSAGTMDRMGLGRDVLAAARPEIVYLSMPAFGNSGPEASYGGYGATSDQLSGLVSITGYGADEPEAPGINLSDPIAGTHAAAAILAALIERERSGRGSYIDLSHRESTTRLLGPELIDYQLTGEVPVAAANRHMTRAPNGCYPCRGDDRWLALSVGSDDEWRASARVLAIADERFATEKARRANIDDLDAAVAAATRDRDADELMHALQRAGVMAADVRSADRLFADAQLRARSYWRLVEHPEAGAHEIMGLAWKMSADTPFDFTPAPCHAQHTRQVLREVLGYPDEKISALVEAGIIASAK